MIAAGGKMAIYYLQWLYFWADNDTTRLGLERTHQLRLGTKSSQPLTDWFCLQKQTVWHKTVTMKFYANYMALMCWIKNYFSTNREQSSMWVLTLETRSSLTLRAKYNHVGEEDWYCSFQIPTCNISAFSWVTCMSAHLILRITDLHT